MYKLKKDKYRRARGGKAEVWTIHCAKCNELVLVYQKDGTGTLKRCYLNRILAPAPLEKLQRDPAIGSVKDLTGLWCPDCQALIGSPMLHHEGRLAFRLMLGSWSKKRHG